MALSLPSTVNPSRFDWRRGLPVVLIHVLALAALAPALFTWAGLIAMVLGVHLFGHIGINLCYHRLLTHRSFKVPRWLERLLVVDALCSLQDSPAYWVVTHRLHHNHSDKQPDPHSPMVRFAWGHMGWLLKPNNQTRQFDTFRRFAGDLMDDPFYRYLERRPKTLMWIYAAHAVLFAVAGWAAGYLLGWSFYESARLGLSLLVWGVFVRTVVVWHVTWSVNSLSHMFGYRNYETDEHSRNNWFVALLTAGEGWHNNHHWDPAGATVQHHWWELDPTYYEIKLLAWLGLATD